MTTTTANPIPESGNPDHYDENVFCPHCELTMCADWDDCDHAHHDVPNCPAAE